MAELLQWDQTGERDIESGISKVVLFPWDTTNNDYGAGVAWSGVTALNENPGGADVTDLYADNIKYATLRAAETFGFTIEAYTYPDEWAECDGSKAAVTGVAVGQQTRKAFGLAYRTEIGDDTHPGMDKGYKLHIVYNCTASPSSRSYSTINNSPDAISFSWEGTSTPVAFTTFNSQFKPTSLITIDSTQFTTANGKKSLLDALEAKLYGTAAVTGTNAAAAVPAELPTPDEVLTTLGYTLPSP